MIPHGEYAPKLMPCPMCGGGSADNIVTFHGGRGFVFRHHAYHTFFPTLCLSHPYSHIHVFCQNCGYAWIMSGNRVKETSAKPATRKTQREV